MDGKNTRMTKSVTNLFFCDVTLKDHYYSTIITRCTINNILEAFGKVVKICYEVTVVVDWKIIW